MRVVVTGGAGFLGRHLTARLAARGDAPVILRLGALAPEDLAAVHTGGTVAAPDDGAPRSPGQLFRHYGTAKPLRLNAAAAEDGEVLIGFGPTLGAALSLSETGDLTEAAARLFAVLHEADARPEPRIAVAPVPATGLGAALNDRLQRAAASTT